MRLIICTTILWLLAGCSGKNAKSDQPSGNDDTTETEASGDNPVRDQADSTVQSEAKDEAKDKTEDEITGATEDPAIQPNERLAVGDPSKFIELCNNPPNIRVQKTIDSLMASVQSTDCSEAGAKIAALTSISLGGDELDIAPLEGLRQISSLRVFAKVIDSIRT